MKKHIIFSCLLIATSTTHHILANWVTDAAQLSLIGTLVDTTTDAASKLRTPEPKSDLTLANSIGGGDFTWSIFNNTPDTMSGTITRPSVFCANVHFKDLKPQEVKAYENGGNCDITKLHIKEPTWARVAIKPYGILNKATDTKRNGDVHMIVNGSKKDGYTVSVKVVYKGTVLDAYQAELTD